MKIIVTGGAGFIGSNLVETISNTASEVVIIDNFSTGRLENIPKDQNNLTLVEADISKPGNWQDSFRGADVVYHIAALADIVPSIENPKSYFESNVTGTLNVLEAMRRHSSGKLIYTASSSCYGLAKRFPTAESDAIDIQYPYALTKYMGEQLVLSWAKVYDIEATSARLFNVYGRKSRTSGTYGAMFGVFLAQRLNGEPLTVVGDGAQKRDFIYVSDVCKALIALAQKGVSGQVYNVGTGQPCSVMQIAKRLSDNITLIPKRPGEPDLTHADITKIQAATEWQPVVDIDTGIDMMLENIDYWRDAPVWTPSKIEQATRTWFENLGKDNV